MWFRFGNTTPVIRILRVLDYAAKRRLREQNRPQAQRVLPPTPHAHFNEWNSLNPVNPLMAIYDNNSEGTLQQSTSCVVNYSLVGSTITHTSILTTHITYCPQLYSFKVDTFIFVLLKIILKRFQLKYWKTSSFKLNWFREPLCDCEVIFSIEMNGEAIILFQTQN